jgi:hypothetical protein
MHASPFAFVARHAPPLQNGWPAAVQSASVEQAPTQAVPAALQAAGVHDTVVGGGHAPEPSQVAASVAMPPAQLALRHEVELPGYVQPAEFPAAHAPPHAVPAPAHDARAPWGCPATTAVHLPPGATSHASHRPSQLPSQQTPSTQLPLLHVVPPSASHRAPSGRP